MNLFFWDDSNYSFWLPNCCCLYLNMLNIKYFSLQVINTKDNLCQLFNKINSSNSVSKIVLCLLLTIIFSQDTTWFCFLVDAFRIDWIFFPSLTPGNRMLFLLILVKIFRRYFMILASSVLSHEFSLKVRIIEMIPIISLSYSMFPK